MANIAVSVSMGVMKPLLEKLATLMGDEYKKLKGLRKEVSFLKSELNYMNAVLEKMDEADKLDPEANTWRKDAIEMSYNIEDYINEFMDTVGEASNNMGFLHKASHYLKTFKDRHRLANQFREIKTLVIEVGERRKRYMFDPCIPSTTHVTVDPRLSALYQKSERLVGIESQKEEIVTWLMNEEQQLKVMSIIGCGGLGKTTLANEVYREVGGKFNCKAFVSISQSPDIIKLLNSLMLQVGLQPYSHACEVQDLINSIVKYLENKRYFIVVDDLWDIRAWNTISCAFVQNNRYSRVMITTRIENVGRESYRSHGFIHYMKPLSDQDSRKLFFDRICESEDAYPPDLMEASSTILKKCGGLPLAIITVASMIACQPTRLKGQWAEYIGKSMGAEFTANPTYEDMMHVIDFSYKNLPYHLKTCFLYLGTYPEDRLINRADLVRRWVAEDLVSSSCGQEVGDVAESYFNELVNRSMIQPAYGFFDSVGTEVAYFRVHDMMLELILRKCRENNFLSMIDGPKMMSEGHDKVPRRLTIDIRGAEGGITVEANTRHLSKVRSLNIFRGNFQIPNLVEFKYIRLLFLDISYLKTEIDLSGINHLSKLRYLKVSGNYGDKVQLPSQIRGLRVLETLDLSEMFGCCRIPEIVDVPHLSHISVPVVVGMRLPTGIGKMKLLVTLSGFSLPKSSLECITALGELSALSQIYLTCRKRDRWGMTMPLSTLVAALIASLEKLSNLRILVLGSQNQGTIYCRDAMQGPSFRKIERLDLQLLIFSGVPRWVGHLRCLRELVLSAENIYQEDLDIIGTRLTSLIILRMRISCIPTESITIGGSTGFQVLKVFSLDCDGVSCLTFEAGAMPNLLELELFIDTDGWDKATPVGLQHLPSLTMIEVFPAKPGSPASVEEFKAMHALLSGVFQEAVDALPTLPTVSVAAGWVVRPEKIMT